MILNIEQSRYSLCLRYINININFAFFKLALEKEKKKILLYSICEPVSPSYACYSSIEIPCVDS